MKGDPGEAGRGMADSHALLYTSEEKNGSSRGLQYVYEPTINIDLLYRFLRISTNTLYEPKRLKKDVGLLRAFYVFLG